MSSTIHAENNDGDDDDDRTSTIQPPPPPPPPPPITNPTTLEIEGEDSKDSSPNRATGKHERSNNDDSNNNNNDNNNDDNNNNNNNDSNNNNNNHNVIHEENDNDTQDRRLATLVYSEVLKRVCIDFACNMHQMIKTGDIPITYWKVPLTRQELYPELYKQEDIDKDPLYVEKILEQYATEVPASLLSRKRKRRSNLEEVIIRETATTTTLDGGTNENDPVKTAMTTIGSSTIAANTTSGNVVAGSGNEGSTNNSYSDLNNKVEDKQEEIKEEDSKHSFEVSATTAGDGPSTRKTTTTSHLDIWGNVPPNEPKTTCECTICGRRVSALRFAPHLDKCMGLSTRGPSSSSTSSSPSPLGSNMLTRPSSGGYSFK